MNLGRLVIDVPSSHSRLGTKVSWFTISRGTQMNYVPWFTISRGTQMNYVPGGLGIMDRQGVQAAWNQGLK
jgi:hypothetical protein